MDRSRRPFLNVARLPFNAEHGCGSIESILHGGTAGRARVDRVYERPPTRANTRRVAAGIMVQGRYDRSQTPREGPGSSGHLGDRIGTPNAQNNRRVDITPPRRLNIEAPPSGWKAESLNSNTTLCCYCLQNSNWKVQSSNLKKVAPATRFSRTSQEWVPPVTALLRRVTERL